MPRPLQRVRLESGFKLNLNSLVRRGFIKPGAITGPVGIVWTDDTGQQIASGYHCRHEWQQKDGSASDLVTWINAYI